MVSRIPVVAALVLLCPVGAAASPRRLDAQQREIIKQYVLRQAKASVIAPRTGEAMHFAHALETALRAAGAWVSVDQSDPVPEKPGLTLIYDHTVPADSSIFLALQRAGLNPKDEDIPGAPVATLIVGPQSYAGTGAQRVLATRPPIPSKPSGVSAQ